MRQVTATEKYRAVNEGKLAQGEFVRQMRLSYPSVISQWNSYDDTVQILKNRGYISEKTGVEVYDHRYDLNISPESVLRGVRYELQAKGLDPSHELAYRNEELLGEIEAVVVKNLKKHPLHYINLLANESDNVDKHDKPVETKRAALDTDTFNGMKKAELNESVISEKKALLENAVHAIKQVFPELTKEIFKEFIDTHYTVLVNNPKIEVAEEFMEWAYINHYIEDRPESLGEDLEEDTFYRPGDCPEGGKHRYKRIDKDGTAECEKCGLRNSFSHRGSTSKKAEPNKSVNESSDVLENARQVILDKYGEVDGIEDRIQDFLDTHEEDIISGVDVLDEFENFVTANYDSLYEKKGKDHDGDGDVDSDDYLAAKDKAIKKAMGKDEMVKENIKAIIQKVLEEGTINEAATNRLANLAEDYAEFEGMKPAIIQLQDIVTEIEKFYDNTRGKIQKVYNTLGDIRNEEGLKVGGFLAPAIEKAFRQDLSPVVEKGFTGGLDTPKVRVMSKADVDALREEGDIQEEPKQTVFSPNN